MTSIIRKLSIQEILYDNETLNNNLILSRVFLLDLANGLQLTDDTLKTACKHWIRRHPLLACCVRRTDKELERYFERLEDKVVYALDNVEFVESCDDWKGVMDKDIVLPFVMEGALLWRVKLLRLSERARESTDYNYCLLLSTQHSIGDGRNIYEVGVQLINILGALVEGKTCEEMDESVVEHSNYTREEYVEQKQLKYREEKTDDWTHDKRESKYLSTPDDDSYGKFQYFTLQPEKLKKILALKNVHCKSAKFGSIVCTLLAYAYRSLYKKNKVDDIPLDDCQHGLLASIREKIGIKNTQMGVFSGLVHFKIDVNEADLKQVEELNFERFWQKADQHATSLFDKLKHNEEFTFFAQAEEAIQQLKAKTFDEKYVNFYLSSYGQMRNSSSAVLRIKEHHLRMPSTPNRIGSIMFICATSIDNRFTMGFSYHENNLSSSRVSELVEELLKLIDNLIQSK